MVVSNSVGAPPTQWGKVQLPDLVRTGGLGGEDGLAAGGELAAFALVGRLQQQPFTAQQPQHAGLADAVAFVTAPVIGMTQTLE
ncbi:hypothetical protein [Kineococcus sp. SYSU DK005]|uniref:hypothetical protein n=1 Tax=Kineococcus sp. SYSU DK005 TaxID=3383126 RepID=UPI003D7F174B